MKTYTCSTCERELEEKEVRYCSICKATLCIDCIRYVGVRRKTIYREYEDVIPVCHRCFPKVKVRGKLAKILDEVFGNL